MSSVEARTPALDDRVVSAQAPRARAARARRPVAQSGWAQSGWAQSGWAQPALRGSSRRTRSYSEGSSVGRLEQKCWMVELREGEISWVLAALRIATRAVKPLATHSSYKRKNSSLRERAACGGWLVALTPSRTTLAQDAQRWRARDRSRQVEWYTAPVPSLSQPAIYSCEGGGGEAGGGVATAWPQPAWVRHLPLEGEEALRGGWFGVLTPMTVLQPHPRGGKVAWPGRLTPLS